MSELHRYDRYRDEDEGEETGAFNPISVRNRSKMEGTTGSSPLGRVSTEARTGK